ncbi:MAG: hypothetical protein ACXACP_06640 [Candidatus Hodarchaeales archaeon]|jgi:hypothetical protein
MKLQFCPACRTENNDLISYCIECEAPLADSNPLLNEEERQKKYIEHGKKEICKEKSKRALKKLIRYFLG